MLDRGINCVDEAGKIVFDGESSINYHGLIAYGLSQADANAIFDHLLSSNSIKGSIEGHFFLNCLMTVENSSRKFTKYGLVPKQQLSIQGFIKELLFEIYQYKIRRGYIVESGLKFSGFYKTIKTNAFLDSDKSEFMRLQATDFSYVNGVKVPNAFFCYIHKQELDAEQLYGMHFPKRDTLSGLSQIERIKNELYFREADVIEVIKAHFQSDTVSLNEIEATQIYENGLLQEDRTLVEPSGGHSKRDLVIETHRRIIAAFILMLKNRKHIRTEKQSTIYRHLEDHFKGIAGLNERYISEFIRPAMKELKAQEKDAGYEKSYLERVK